MESFAKRLTLLRESRNLKKKDLAKVLNVTPACISQYENNLSMPGEDILLRIANYFNVSVDFLLANDTSSVPFDLGESFCEGVSYYDLLLCCSNLPLKYRKIILTMIELFNNESYNKECGA